MDSLLQELGTGKRWLRVWNSGGADAPELWVIGGQSVSKSGESGIFHMGSKQAFAALLLLEKKVVVSSYDHVRGRYIATWDTYHRAEQDTGEQILVNIVSEKHEPERHELSYTTHFGKAIKTPLGDDPNPLYKSIAQLLINSVEAAKLGARQGKWGIEHVDNLNAARTPGTTSVFVEACDFTQEILDYLPYYFKVEHHKMVSHPKIADIGRDIELWKSTTDGEQFNLYVRSNGIAYLVYAKEGGKGGFGHEVFKSGVGDYVIRDDDGKLLDSDRELKDINDALNEIATAWSECANVSLLSRYLKAARDDTTIESSMGSRYYHIYPEKLKEAFKHAFPNGALQRNTDKPNAIQYATEHGADIVELPSTLTYMLASAGVKSIDDARGLTGGKLTRKPTSTETKAINLVARWLTEADLLFEETVAYVVVTESSTDCLGYANRAKSEIGLAVECFTAIDGFSNALVQSGSTDELPDYHTLLSTMIHEHRHLRSRAEDNTAGFTKAADWDLARLVTIIQEARDV